MRRLVAVLSLVFLLAAFADGPEPATPAEFRRAADNTYLTFPEWFLVSSPAEYADFIRENRPSEFPYLRHLGQLWGGYLSVTRAVRAGGYPSNFGYHFMIWVIGSSTTVEYGLKVAYETLVGRLTEMTCTHGPTPEDRFAQEYAQDYVDFVRVRPWYEYDFTRRLRQLWTLPATGPDMLRKWERRYILTTEFFVKIPYGWLIGRGSQASYGAESTVTAVLVDHLPADIKRALPALTVIKEIPGRGTLATIPRYDAFKNHALALARNNVRFHEIAGNASDILVAALVPDAWQPPAGAGRTLFEQSIPTRPGTKRVVLVGPVPSLSEMLRALDRQDCALEHVYDY